MLNEDRLRKLLPVSGLGEPLYFYPEVGSTNDVAIALANKGAPHGALVIAEGQTAGRGQRGRKWRTIPGGGLAMSIILKPVSFTGEDWMKYHALGALFEGGTGRMKHIQNSHIRTDPGRIAYLYEFGYKAV